MVKVIAFDVFGTVVDWRSGVTREGEALASRLGLPSTDWGEVADRWRYLDGEGEFGIISSVTVPFCRDCTRARLSADGQLYTCLFAVQGRDVRAVLRDGSSDEQLVAFLTDTWRARDDRYSELRSASTTSSNLPKVEMFAMGG